MLLQILRNEGYLIFLNNLFKKDDTKFKFFNSFY